MARGAMTVSDLDAAFDLPTIPLDADGEPGSWLAADRIAFEDRYAELGFGLGVVPRRRRRDDPWWETPLGLLACLGGTLLLLLLLAAG
jgi:hypothetical protein